MADNQGIYDNGVRGEQGEQRMDAEMRRHQNE
jgi:hypothetical protein